MGKGATVAAATAVLFLAVLDGVACQLESPCPRLFSYEPQKENDRWYGVVTLISESDLSGVWLRLIFDKPSLQLGNWFGEINTMDNMEYLIKNRNHQLKANMPYALRFYIKYDPAESPPKLVAIRLNAKTVCPEGVTTTPPAITGGQLQTSGSLGTTTARPATHGTTVATHLQPVAGPPAGVTVARPGSTFVRPGGGWQPGTNPGSTDETDDVFPGDFQLINRPSLKPTENFECGTVVVPKRRKRQTGYSSQYAPFYEYLKQLLAHLYFTGRVATPPKYTYYYYADDEKPPVRNHSYYYAVTGGASEDTEYSVAGGVSNRSDVGYNYVVTGGVSDDDDEIAPLEAQPRPLITYGQATSEGEFPWHAALYHERGADLQYICGASLIARNYVITVAHCVTRRKTQQTLNPDSLIVYLGKYYLKKWSNPGIQDSQVSQIVAHPDYNSHSYSNDIALIKLYNPVQFTDFVRPVCLWSDDASINSVVNKPGTVVGWGFDHTGSVTEELTQAKMPVVAKETCIYSFPDFFSRFTTSKTYCAGFRNGTSVCNGDSGGGMVFPKQTSTPNRRVWQLRGLVSISVALQNQFRCDASHYVVFTDIAKYLDWIKEVMK